MSDITRRQVATAALLAQAAQRAAGAGVTASVMHPSYQHDLADEFFDLAREINALLIVIGLCHRTQMGKFIMGSHAQFILIQADRPVLAVGRNGQRGTDDGWGRDAPVSEGSRTSPAPSNAGPHGSGRQHEAGPSRSAKAPPPLPFNTLKAASGRGI